MPTYNIAIRHNPETIYTIREAITLLLKNTSYNVIEFSPKSSIDFAEPLHNVEIQKWIGSSKTTQNHIKEYWIRSYFKYVKDSIQSLELNAPLHWSENPNRPYSATFIIHDVIFTLVISATNVIRVNISTNKNTT